MQIWTPPPAVRRDDGEVDVRLTTGARPFAVIGLSEDWATALTMETPGDCDRLIRAAVLAKSLLLGEAAPAAPEICGAAHPEGIARCQRPGGHQGGHKNDTEDKYWQRAEDDAGRAIAASLGEQHNGTDAS